MSGDELKARLKELVDARSRIEPQIAAASARLDAAGVGMQGSLLDNEVRIACCSWCNISHLHFWLKVGGALRGAPFACGRVCRSPCLTGRFIMPL